MPPTTTAVREAGPPAPVLVPAPLGTRRPARPAPASRAYWLRLALAFTALAFLLRLPSFTRPVWNPDEGYLAVEARLLAHGGVLYGTVVDRKPPLLPLLYQGLFALFGDGSLWPVRVAAVLATAATALLLAAVAHRRWGARSGTAAGLGCLLLSVGLAPEDTQAAAFEVFILPWTAAAVWCADRHRWTAAGLAVAGAALTKQTGAVTLLPVAWTLWRAARAGRTRGPAGAARLAAGCAAPVAAVALLTGPGRFLFWTVTGSAEYVSPRGAWLTALSRAAGAASILAVAAAGLLLAVGAAWAVRDRPVPGDLWVWPAASALAVASGCQFYGHYFLQLVPPLALTGAAALRALPRTRTAVACWTALACAGFLAWDLTAPAREAEHARTVAAAVRAHTGPRDHVLVWGIHPEELWFADRPPAVRYPTAGFLTNFSGGRGGVRVGERYAVPGTWRTFAADFAAHPPALVVDDSRGAPYAVDRTPTLRELLGSGYRRAGTVDGAVLYVRADGGPA
ncbi:glycosyltransferase family 39 protein [Actinacidiphila alni]|uniref:glycosyltransferase family 39 protein n=1 Tax=Actinacidiphila alni TaxID=380248 RepID=UPI003F4CBC51